MNHSSTTRRQVIQQCGIAAGALLLGAGRGIVASQEPARATKIVWGIAELFEWVFRKQKSTGRDTEDCLQAHLDCGIRHVIWAIGRSTVDYHSKLPHTTLYVGDSRPETKVIGEAMKLRCTLRAALAFAKEHGMTLYTRLGMNRHYGGGYGGGLTSKFAAEHPEWHCATKAGRRDGTRLSYFFPEYRRERLDILCEVARIGAHGLCLDFCRQVPMLRYEPKLVEAYIAQGKGDPRKLDINDPQFLDWCCFRCGYVTTFLRDLRRELRTIEKDTGRKVPVMARVTDAGLNVNLMEGTDVETWMKEGLIDELCANPLWWLSRKYPDTIAPYAKLARSHGVKMWGGVGCLPAQKTRVNPVSFLRRVARQYDEGADGVALYQSDTGIRDDVLKPVLPKLSDPAAVAALLADRELLAKHPQDNKSRHFGVDNHSKIEALGVAASPMGEL
ncbi:MAG: twin-arginine translocation signal domain-containing protein [Verrucomicrobia bacterium]|nr:twin-arginine translocation signal domain-containing protein [Verrucomicrobiota bacterium]